MVSTLTPDLLAQRPLLLMAVGTAGFAGIYFLFGGLNWWLTRSLLPRLGYGRRIDPRPLPPGQVRQEIRRSLGSVLVFGIGLVVPWAMLHWGWARLALDASWPRVLLEMAVLLAWNELHFYANHRLLHTRWLRRFHLPHHRSQVTTPFATYSFHPLEAMLLGSVPLLPMLLHDFSLFALLSLPVMSLVLNNLGHSNYEFSSRMPARGWRAASRRHHLHHVCYHGNYGFLFNGFDRWFGTALTADVAKARFPKPCSASPSDVAGGQEWN